MIKSSDIIKDLEKRLHTFSLDGKEKNIGIVEKNNDGVITASGLSGAFLGEIIEFKKGKKGLVLNLNEDSVSIILFGNGQDIVEGDEVKTTGELLSVAVSEELLGRVVDALGQPLDGKPGIKKGKNMPLERIAAGVVERQPVETPMKTGIKAIDAMVPIGRGQRELIIGDRGLGKTTVAIDTIINQKNVGKKTDRVICVYVAVGQKQSTIAQIIDRLDKEEALEYSIVVGASASSPAAMQYLAPYAGTAIAEYFLEKGKDVLIVYDDLTKHAWAYRQLTLTLGRPAGREAYPGDVFYLHSRLLERAVRLNKENGGGSITALPIIETQAGDISAYIPTNVISITDGQIFLESQLFNSGFRPAINVGNSVSRVGGAAQTGTIKSVAGKMRLDLAQFRALEAFAQFGSELDAATLHQLERGRRVSQILIQPPYSPLPESFEVLSIWLATSGNLDEIALPTVQRFEAEFHEFVKAHHKKLIEELSTGKKLSEEVIKMMQKAVDEFKKVFSK
jgi:F-type H+-transporting ATPase subunit alpha